MPEMNDSAADQWCSSGRIVFSQTYKQTFRDCKLQQAAIFLTTKPSLTVYEYRTETNSLFIGQKEAGAANWAFQNLSLQSAWEQNAPSLFGMSILSQSCCFGWLSRCCLHFEQFCPVRYSDFECHRKDEPHVFLYSHLQLIVLFFVHSALCWALIACFGVYLGNQQSEKVSWWTNQFSPTEVKTQRHINKQWTHSDRWGGQTDLM